MERYVNRQNTATPMMASTAPRPVPIEMLSLIQKILLMVKPDGIPVDDLPMLYKQATDEELNPNTFGAKDMYTFLRMSCFKKVVDVRKRKTEHYVKGCPLGLPSIGLLRNERNEARPRSTAMEIDNSPPQPEPAEEVNPPLRAVMPAPVLELPQLVKAPQENSDVEPKLEKEGKKSKYKPDNVREAKPKIFPSSSAACHASTSAVNADNIVKKAITGPGPAALEVDDSKTNTCRAVVVYGEAPPPEDSVLLEKEKPKAPTAASSVLGEALAAIPAINAPQAQAASPEDQSKVATNGSASTVVLAEATANFMLSMFKEVQEGFKLQQEQMAAMVQKIEVIGTARSCSRRYREKARDKNRRNEITESDEDEAEPLSPGSPEAKTKATKVRKSYEKYEFFVNGQLFKKRAQYYLAKYGKKDRTDLAGQSGQNMYTLHLNYLNDPYLTEKEIRGMFPKAILGMIGPSKNGRTAFLNLLFKRPKYTMAAHKLARKVFGRDIFVAYGQTQLIGIGSPKPRVSFVINEEENEDDDADAAYADMDMD